jgi:hypothetical protein
MEKFPPLAVAAAEGEAAKPLLAIAFQTLEAPKIK